MNTVSNDEQGYPDSWLKQHIKAEIETGIASAADPTNAYLPDLALRTTSISSPWFSRICKVCGDKFREGDQVRLCPKCNTAYHDDDQYELHCWQKKFANGAICNEGGPDRFSESGRVIPRCEFRPTQATPDEVKTIIPLPEMSQPHISPAQLLVQQFISGVNTSWRPFGEEQSIRVTSGSEFVGRKCPWCRFRVRVGDWVVACPCQGNCGTFFHQDVFRHLTCWNEWNGVEGNNYCPNTGKLFPNAEGAENGH